MAAREVGNSQSRSSAAGAPLGRVTKAMEDEVHGALGGVLGLLEVLSIDVKEPLSARQQRVVADALRFGDGLRSAVESLLVLLSDDADPRFAKSPYALRRLIDHAVRAAHWSAREKGVTLLLPDAGPWESTLVCIDAGRVDRAVRAITDALVAAAGAQGQVVVGVEVLAAKVALRLAIEPFGSQAALQLPLVQLAAWQRLIEAQDGALHVDRERGAVLIELPRAEEQR